MGGSFLFFIVLGLVMLFYKFDRCIFILISFEFIVLGLFFYLLFSGESFLALLFLFSSVISSVSSLVSLVSVVKTYGKDSCYY